MPRVENILRCNRQAAWAEIEIVDTFFLRQVLDDGSVVRFDGVDLWSHRGRAWYGESPVGWDRAKAVFSKHVEVFETEVDYS